MLANFKIDYIHPEQKHKVYDLDWKNPDIKYNKLRALVASRQKE